MGFLRAPLVAAVVVAGSLAFGMSAPSALAPRGSDPCAGIETLRTALADLESARSFDADGYRQVAKDFKRAAKSAPKELRSAMKKLAKLYAGVGKAKNDSDAVNAYGTGLVKYDKELTRFRTYYEEQCGGTAGSTGGGSSGSGAGTLTLGSETVALGPGRCYLQEQTAAGQKILWTAQASGTNAAGDNVIVDVSRYDASSQFAGDDLNIDVGDPRSPSFVGWNGRYDSGTIALSGKTVSASGVEVGNDDLETMTASFEISC